MWLKVGEVGYVEVRFTHLHDGRRHQHDALVASVEAHRVCHRLQGRVAADTKSDR
jgi:hypothetical protein